jgi:hypothetical protein
MRDGGSGCIRRARLAADVVATRLEKLGVRCRELRGELIGFDSLFGAAHVPSVEPIEVRLRIAARVDSCEEAEAIGREVEGLWVAGPYGGGGATRSVREVIGVGSLYIPRELVQWNVELLEA